jgi:hypothetical protein
MSKCEVVSVSAGESDIGRNATSCSTACASPSASAAKGSWASLEPGVQMTMDGDMLIVIRDGKRVPVH